jgi:hypothetical protein
MPTVEPVETVLYGPVPDQSALHGLLDRIESLGLELVEIRQLPTSPDDPQPPSPHDTQDPSMRQLRIMPLEAGRADGHW